MLRDARRLAWAQVAWLDEPEPTPTPENPDAKLDVSQWWKTLAARGGMNKVDWREIRMKSTIKLPAPGAAPASPPQQETFADQLAVEAAEAETERDGMKSDLALMRKENDNLRSELKEAQRAEVVARANLEKELVAHKTEVARLQAQIQASGGGVDADGGALLYLLIALVVLLLGVIGYLVMPAPTDAD